jgi:membrane protease YdiL (CAAX protease family)
VGSAQRANGLIAWLLRSSFSGMLESSVMLLTVRGRRTGRRHTFPVQYMEDGPVLWVLPGGHERKSWWRNLLEECPVRLLVRGQELCGLGRAVRGETEIRVVEEGLRVYLRRFPNAARRLGVGGSDGIDPERLHSLAARSVMVRIQLPPGGDWAMVGARAGERGVEDGNGVVGPVRRHPLGAFYLLTFLISWGYWVPDAIGGGHASHFPGLLGPMLAAIVVTGLTRGRAGLRDLASRMFRWRVGLRWYLAAALPLVAALVTAGVLAAAGAAFPGWSAFGRMPGLPAIGPVGVALLTLVINGFGEERGWRGFALPSFRRRHRRLQASVLVAMPWILWHLPTFFLDTGYRGALDPRVLPGFVLGIFAGAIVLTWLYEGSGASILLAALWHTSLNLGSATEAGGGLPAVIVTLVVVGWALVVSRGWARQETASVSTGDQPSR